VNGGGDNTIHSANDITNVDLPDLAISQTHTGNFFVGETGATYTITVSNVGTVATAGGTLLVDEILPAGFTELGAGGAGWNCSVLPGLQTEMSCSRTADPLPPAGSYPPLRLVVSVGANTHASVTNSVTLLGIGESSFANNIASDATTVLPLALAVNSNTSVAVTAGSAGTFAITANLSTAQPLGTVTLSATGLPPNSTVSFDPGTLTQTGSVTMTVNTSGNGHTASVVTGTFDRRIPYSVALLVFIGLLGLNIVNQQARRRLRVATCVYGLAVLLLIAGCGGGGGGSTTPSPTPNPTPGATTPSGTYIIVVTATSSTPGVAPATTPVTLVVQ
jgi:hypothetical protein